MAKHSSGDSAKHKGGKPGRGQAARTGNGVTGGAKPTKNAITQRNSSGGIIRAVTKALWRGGKG